MKTVTFQANKVTDYIHKSLRRADTIKSNSWTTVSAKNLNQLQKNKQILQEFQNQSMMTKKKQMKLVKNQNDDFIFRLKLKMITLLKMLQLQSRNFLDVQKQPAKDLLQLLGKKIREYSKDFNAKLKQIQKNKKNLQIRIIQLQTKIKYLQTSIQSSTKKNQRLNKQAKMQSDNTLNIIHQFQQAKNQFCRQQKKNRQIIEAKNQYCKKLQKNNKILQRKNQEAQSIIKKRQQQISNLKQKNFQEIKNCQQQMSRMKQKHFQEIKKCQQQISRLKKIHFQEIKKYEQQISLMKQKHLQQIKKYKEQYECLEDSISSLQQANRSHKIQVQQLNRKLWQKQIANKRYIKQIAQLQEENDLNFQRYQKQNKKCDQKTQQIKNKTQQIKILSQKLTFYGQKIKISQNQSISLVNRINQKCIYLQNISRQLVQYSQNQNQVKRMLDKIQKLQQYVRQIQIQKDKQIKSMQQVWKIKNQEDLLEINIEWNKKLSDLQQEHEGKLEQFKQF